MITATALVFVVNVITAVVKRWIYPTFGATGVQAIAFLAATIGALYAVYGGNYPGLVELVSAGLGVFSLAVTFYEVILSKFDIFKQPDVTR